MFKYSGCFIICNLSLSSDLTLAASFNVTNGVWISIIAAVSIVSSLWMTILVRSNYRSWHRLPCYILGNSCLLLTQGVAMTLSEDNYEDTMTINGIIDDIPFNLISALSWVCYTFSVDHRPDYLRYN